MQDRKDILDRIQVERFLVVLLREDPILIPFEIIFDFNEIGNNIFQLRHKDQ